MSTMRWNWIHPPKREDRNMVRRGETEMIEILIDCYDGKVHGKETKVQVHAICIKDGMRFAIWDIDHKELVATFRVNKFDLEDFLKIAKALIREMDVWKDRIKEVR